MRAYVINIMVVLIIFPVILQTDISVIMLSIGRQGAIIMIMCAKDYKLNLHLVKLFRKKCGLFFSRHDV